MRIFLIKCDINRKDFGEQDASTKKSVFDIINLAGKNVLIIQAHIDEYNGINSISYSNIEKMYKLECINSAHIVHKEFLDSNINNDALRLALKNHYGNSIDDSTIQKWKKPVELAQKYKKALLTFSDNPHSERNSKHGLWGIGQRYTWIKMQESPTLDSLRQSFLLPEYRVRNCFEYPNFPYEQPNLWIKSISVRNTHITDRNTPLIVEFSPQLNTLIGGRGRGSGKSSILKFIRGVFNKVSNLEGLKDLKEDHLLFYQKRDGENGVLEENSIIEVVFVRSQIEYKITASFIDGEHFSKVEKFDGINKWNENTDEGFIDFFEFEHFSQKQIYEIAKKPNSLREIIDKSIENMSSLKNEKEEFKRKFLEKCATIRKLEQQIIAKGKLKTELNDLKERIDTYGQKCSNIFHKRNIYLQDEREISKFVSEILNNKNAIDELLEKICIPVFSGNNEELGKLSIESTNSLINIKSQLEKLSLDINSIGLDYKDKVSGTSWQIENIQNKLDTDKAIEDSGIININQIEQLQELVAKKEHDLDNIRAIELNLSAEKEEKNKLAADYFHILENITELRINFVNSILKDSNVKIKIEKFRNKSDFKKEFRKILEREREFIEDIDFLIDSCFKGKVEEQIKIFRKNITKIRQGDMVENIGGHFKNFIARINDAKLDEIAILMPEDEIKVEYRPIGGQNFKSLSTASDGQKTTAILTFILSHGTTPLILDQPEDDLDNKLVYELIVERLREAKEQRQLIIATHNANIPVNADAEYVISMNSESTKIKTLITGSVDSPEIQAEICSVMEGGENAFKMRSKRYRL